MNLKKAFLDVIKANFNNILEVILHDQLINDCLSLGFENRHISIIGWFGCLRERSKNIR